MPAKTKLFFLVAIVVTVGCYVATRDRPAPPKDEVEQSDVPAKVKQTPAVQIGQPVAELRFKDIRYLPRSLDDFKENRAFVLVFTNTTCPLVQRYLPVLQSLEKEYRNRGIQFLAVNSSEEDTIVDLATQAVEFGMEFPFVKDINGQCVAALGVQRTPEVVVLDAERRLRYRGRINDQYRLGGTKPEPSREDLRIALEEVLAGREVAVAETPVDGCLINPPSLRPRRERVTYAEHVAPILRQHCQECHRPGTPAPFALLTYEQAAGKARMIAEVVSDRRMPPWYASPKFGHFVNRRGLSTEERETLIAWATSDRERGDASKLAPSHQAASDSWLIGEPDLTTETSEYELPDTGDIPYKYAGLDLTFPEEVWLQGVQILPDNPRVVHHCNLIVFPAGGSYRQGRLVTGTVPGGEPMRLDPGTAYRIPKDSALLLQIHFVSTGKPEKCKIRVGFRHARGVVQKQLRYLLMADSKFAIPPGAPAHRTGAVRTFDRDAVGLAMFVHMHVRGRDMSFLAHRPDGTTERLLMVPNYNFDWQLPYRWQIGEKRFPKGTRIETIAHFDNSTFNPFNPDPTATVKDGLQTKDEMSHGYLFYFDDTEQLNLEIDPATGRAKTSVTK
jgi:thiol-disulfide isomerase/thioredoxin/mono/diheme cytochrome c family protein